MAAGPSRRQDATIPHRSRRGRMKTQAKPAPAGPAGPQRKPQPWAGRPAVDAATRSLQADIAEAVAARGGGQPLPAAMRREMEARFGADLGSVRIHADAAAGA